MSEGAFFRDLALLMSVAGLSAALFSRLGWPKVIGYILAGALMSEHTLGVSLFRDPQSISTVGQLGVVFLMFSMGLSLKPWSQSLSKSPSAGVQSGLQGSR